MTRRNLSIYNLEISEPDLMKEWNYSKNNKPPNLFFRSSKDKVWWKCSKNHEWQASIVARSCGKQKCPYCANKKPCVENCLATKNPILAEEWSEKNLLTPSDYLPNSHQKVWWKCKTCQYEWQANIYDRNNGTKCTSCNYGYTLRDRKDIYNEDFSQKRCKICEMMLSLDNFRLKGNHQKGFFENNICRTCDASKIKDYRLTDKGIAAEIVRRTKHISKKKKLDFNLDVSWVYQRLLDIDWKCELTKLPMRKNREKVNHKHEGFMWDSISIDKIDPKLGYVKDNVRFISNIINLFKHKGTDAHMYMLAENLLLNRK